MALPIQGIWRSNNYIKTFRLVDYCCFYKVGKWAIYIQKVIDTNIHNHAYYHNLIITISILHSQ